MGLIYGDYGGRSDEFAPGGLSFENGFCPHGGKGPLALYARMSLTVLQFPMTSSRMCSPQTLDRTLSHSTLTGE